MFVLKDEEIAEIINSEQFNPWVGTPFENYKQLNNVQKGNAGESIVKSFMKSKGHEIIEHPNRTDSYDVIIDDLKVEIKFSLAQTDTRKKTIIKNKFIMNHVSSKKEWDRLIFLGINLDESYFFKWFSKEEFNDYFKDKYFNNQQGGNSSNNDDYMASGKKLINMLSEMKDEAEW